MSRRRRALGGESFGRDDLTRFALAAGAGDQEALATFVKLSADEIWRYSASVLGSARADDASQEIFARAVKSLPRFRGDSSARSWLFTIARCVVIDDMRARRRQRTIFEKVAAQPVDIASSNDHLPIELVEAMAQLPADQRDAFALTQVLGLSYQEAAALSGCPIGTIRSRVSRARAHLLEVIDPSHDSGELEA